MTTAAEETARPSIGTLERALTAALGGLEQVAVTERSPNWYSSWHPSEVLTCDAASQALQVLCKYDLPWSQEIHGLPAGVSYEADAYRLAVEPCGLSAPRSYGLFSDDRTGAAWLMLEFLAGSCRLTKSTEPGEIGRAARWIGLFHRFHDRREIPPADRLNRHDEATLEACVARAQSACEPLRAEYPWLSGLADEYEGVFCDLFLRRPTVIHGEYYPKNILVRERTVFPIDWERAGVSAGEIDLAALTEGHWKPQDVRIATESYAEARWGADVPDDFTECLNAARVYLHMAALGNEPNEPFKPGAKWRFGQLELAAAERGLL
ncbi:MAG TPA: phosphotransferase [Solirubrobacterales bacterium]